MHKISIEQYIENISKKKENKNPINLNSLYKAISINDGSKCLIANSEITDLV